MKPTFGQLVSELHPLTEQATYVARALHTLQHLRDNSVVRDDGSVSAQFCAQSYNDLRTLLAWFYDQGVRPQDIDLGAFVVVERDD